ncbi:helix-turn-helix domain-containing protein [Desulfobulbus alkaliphilus]|uniref:helix-turn-helix domain-containing protein n=1 Tax=Desulfobulbus alkaliphilus TaxID=869814 RepID=UPI00196514CF|nr:helix-turn-helix domain-containing protein [Desulfobulbus alkaliphilus]MBM9536682.1 helix-turn-helix domain-containing protein [Desulfobulbus alkaliphilus]
MKTSDAPVNPELNLADEFVRHTNSSIFLTGKAGTGKTTFLHTIQQQTHKRLIVTAPTGVAAINAGGVTLHSFFQMPFGPILPGSELHGGQYRLSREKKNIIRSLDLLVIDEISMVRADLLDGIDAVLRRFRRSDQPFGGVQLLMIGDLHQLAPVVKENEWQLLSSTYQSPYFFSSSALAQVELIAIELQHIYRQTDSRFIHLLNRVRDNRIDAEVLTQLNTRYLPDFSPEQTAGCITLCTHNSRADAINRAKLQALAGTSRKFTATIDGTFPEHAFPTAATLELKIGAQVMFVRNDPSADKRYFNGKIGTITGMTRETVRIDCPDEDRSIEVGPATWENPEYRADPETAEISRKVIGTFHQLPLKPAWAITIHKSQGLSFDRAIIDAQAAFAHGQVYVALSRCRSFDGLFLSTPIAPRGVQTDPAILDFVSDTKQQRPTQETLIRAKIRYQQQLLLECFDFEQLRRALDRLVWLLRSNAGSLHLAAGDDIAERQQHTTDAIVTVGTHFRRELLSLFNPDQQPVDDPFIRERLAKASVYFTEKFDTILEPFVHTFTVESDNKEIKKRLSNAVKQFREEYAAKRAAIVSCRDGFSPSRYLRALSSAVMETGKTERQAAPVFTEADVGHPDLFRRLQEWRSTQAKAEQVAAFQVLHQKTLIQIAVHLPDTMAALKKIKGIGSRLAEKYGKEIISLVSGYRQEHGITEVFLPNPTAVSPSGARKKQSAPRVDTKKISLEMHEQGLNIAQIAEKRELTMQTIEGHLAYYVGKGELPVDGLIDEQKRQHIEAAIAAHSSPSLKELKETLGEGYSYGEINLTLAHLRCRDTQ